MKTMTIVVIAASTVALNTMNVFGGEKTESKALTQVTAALPSSWQDSGMRISPTRPNAQLHRKVEAYEKRLLEVLSKLDTIKDAIPTNGVKQTAMEVRACLKQASTTLQQILRDRTALEKEGQVVLQTTADIQERCLTVCNKADDAINKTRKEPLDNPKAVENIVEGYLNVKQAAVRGKERAEPCRKMILDISESVRRTFAEIALWPPLFALTDELCGIYEEVGEWEDFSKMAARIVETRKHLAAIVKQVAGLLEQVAEKPLDTQPGASAQAMQVEKM
jgi:FtsZ-binding cell division protein ZapB